MSDYTTNFPPQTYSSSFYLNSLVDDEKGSLVTKSELSSGSEARNGPLLDCFISTMKYFPVQQLLCLMSFLRLFTNAYSSPTECVLNYDIKPLTFSSLVKFQGFNYSFNPKDPSYKGNIVEFSFDTIDKLPKNSFFSFDSASIIKITLNHKQIKVIDAGAFSGLFCLHRLELKQNNISNLTEEAFVGLDNLHRLDLSENLLKDMSGAVFRHLSNLRELNLSKNRIRNVGTVTFFNLTKLEVLDISYNSIRTLPSAVFSSLQNLRELYLNNNELGNGNPEKWTGLEKLEVLDLAESHLHKFDPSYNFSFKALTKLNLSGNFLTSLDVFSLRRSLVKLTSIDITNNEWLCEDLEVIKYHLADSRIVQMGEPKCDSPGEYKPSSTSSTSTPVAQTTVANVSTPMNYALDTFAYKKEMLFTQKRIEDIQFTQTIFICLFVMVITYVLFDIAIKLGVLQPLYTMITGRNLGRNRPFDQMLL